MSEDEKNATVLTGIVHPRGAGGSMSKGDTLWTLKFTLHTWRDESAVLHTTPLLVTRALMENDLRQFMAQIQPYQILSARVIFENAHTATLLELMGGVVVKDDELQQIVEQLKIPKTYKHEKFGTLEHDARLDWYTTNTRWMQKKIRLQLPAENETVLEDALQNAVQLWDNQTVWHQRITDFVVQELLDLKNDTWLEDDETPHSPESFKQRMTLESITVYRGGRFEFWHDDGDLFWGHSILVSGDLESGPTQADIAG